MRISGTEPGFLKAGFIQAPTPTEKEKQKKLQHKNTTKNFEYTTIADRLRTVSRSNNSHATGVVKPLYERSTFPSNCK